MSKQPQANSRSQPTPQGGNLNGGRRQVVPDGIQSARSKICNATKPIRQRAEHTANQAAMYQENVGPRSTVVLNAPGPPRGVVVPVVHLIHSDPF